MARIFTHGYVGGGYRSGSPWRNVNRTVHATDTSTNLGDTLDRSGAYMSGSWNDRRHFYHSMENTYRGSSTYTSGFSMPNESGITHQNSWDMTVNRGSMGSFQDHVFAGGYSYPAAFNAISFVTIATTGNSQDFGDMTTNRANGNRSAINSSTRGLIGGGYISPTGTNNIQVLQLDVAMTSVINTVADGSITSVKIADGTVTKTDLAFDPEDEAAALAIALG